MINDANKYGRMLFILAGSQVFSKLADRALLVGFSWYLINEYSKTALTIYLIISMLPHLIMTFFSAKLINKFSPIRIMRFSELCRAIFIGMLWLVFLMNLHSIYFSFILILTLGANFFAAVFDPALLTVPRQLDLSSSRYQRVSGLLNSCSSIARMVGPVLALPLYSYVGIKGLTACCFILYLLAWIVELFIANVRWDISSLINDGLKKKYITNLLQSNRTVIKMLLVFFIMNLVVIPIQLFMPLFTKDVFHSGLHLLTIFESSLGAGLLAGGIYIVFFPFKMRMRYRISIPYILASITYIIYALSNKSAFVSASALFLFGMFLAIGNIITISFYQQVTEKHHTAQIMVFVNFISNASGPIALAIAGGLLSIIGLKHLILAYGLIAFTVGMSLVLFKDLNRFSNV